jgi:two-component system, NtrC family, sensor kinase
MVTFGKRLRLMTLSLTTRIFIGYAVVLITFGAVSLFSVSELRRSQVEMRLVSEGYLGLSQTVATIETFQANQSKETDRIGTEKNLEMRRQLIRLARVYFPDLMSEKLEQGRQTAQHIRQFAPQSELPYIQEVELKFQELKRRFSDYQDSADGLFELLENKEPELDLLSAHLMSLKEMETSLGSTIRLLHGSLEARIHERVRMAQERERRTGVAIIFLPLVAIGVGLLATGFAARSLRPVRTLIEGVTRIRKGDFDASIGVAGDDEIAVLAREFDAMAKALRERDAQLNEKQAALLRAERLAAMGRVSAQVAHEVRNPLSSIGLNVEMLQESLSNAAFKEPQAQREAAQLLAAITQEVDRVTEITEDYLRLARLPAPVLRLNSLQAALENVISFSREEMGRAHIECQFSIGHDVPEFFFDENQLRQLLLNLMRNAREAMPSGGLISIQASVHENQMCIRLSDTGPGFSAQALAHLFDPFFTTKEGGTGLGLSLSRQIAEAHGGKLELLESQPGAHFQIILPFGSA